MRTPRLIAIVFAWAVAATAVYLAFATDLPRGVIVLIFFAGFVPYVLWLRIEPYFERSRIAGTEADAGLDCARCRRPIVADPAASRDLLEGMHWLCFHLEFEHDGDPDLPCSDTGCPQWRLEVYAAKLRELGADPREVLDDRIAERLR